MSEIRKDLGYNDELPNEESQQAMRRILAGKPPNDPEPDWQHSQETIEDGKEGIAKSREALHSAISPHKIHDFERTINVNNLRNRLEVQRKAHAGEPLTSQEIDILNSIHRSESD